LALANLNSIEANGSEKSQCKDRPFPFLLSAGASKWSFVLVCLSCLSVLFSAFIFYPISLFCHQFPLPVFSNLALTSHCLSSLHATLANKTHPPRSPSVSQEKKHFIVPSISRRHAHSATVLRNNGEHGGFRPGDNPAAHSNSQARCRSSQGPNKT
jgi:hypothetical protein